MEIPKVRKSYRGFRPYPNFVRMLRRNVWESPQKLQVMTVVAKPRRIPIIDNDFPFSSVSCMSLQARQWSIEASKYAWREPSEKLGCLLRCVYSVLGALPRSGRLNLLWMRKTREKRLLCFYSHFLRFNGEKSAFSPSTVKKNCNAAFFRRFRKNFFLLVGFCFVFSGWELCFFASDLRTRVADFYGY